MSRVGPDRGFSLVEILIVVAIIGLLASIAVPALLNARRHANETSAMASMRAIADAQHAFASGCANGAYASRLTQLAVPPAGGHDTFLAPDLAAADRVVKSGYVFTMAAGSDGVGPERDACNGITASNLSSSYYATAVPESPATGGRSFWVGVSGTVFTAPFAIASTLGQSNPPGAEPIGGPGPAAAPTGDPDPPRPDGR